MTFLRAASLSAIAMGQVALLVAVRNASAAPAIPCAPAAVSSDVPLPATPPSADELNIDRLLSVCEDVAVALTGVDDSTDANLVAARVASDFLLLRGMGQAVPDTANSADLSHGSLRSFKLRFEQARSSVETATARLLENNCYGSDALTAALSLSGLVSGKAITGPAAQTAVQELLANNREMMSLLLDEARDDASAELVATLVSAALKCESALAAYAREIGETGLDDAQRGLFAQRREDFYIDLQNHRERLEPQNYFGCVFLREFIEGSLANK